ncbi:hypothetical protein PG997_000403 [Apiospora hydei]|uniref:Uncharacterized protein n=1 Tax=Apiospora hydei TaxID=1337664 RepID=A0ABR1XAT5_9PEZI
MTTDPDVDFKPTHKFPHPYGDAEVLRTYLIKTAKLKPNQFRIKAVDGELQLMLLIDDIKKVEKDKIVDEFREAARKRREATNNTLPTDD